MRPGAGAELVSKVVQPVTALAWAKAFFLYMSQGTFSSTWVPPCSLRSWKLSLFAFWELSMTLCHQLQFIVHLATHHGSSHYSQCGSSVLPVR